MKIAAISTTKNECDIIESFVRHNSRFCDEFFFVDESNDATREILGHLQNEGFKIVVFNSGSNSFDQSQLANFALQQVASLNEHDWILLLDADEIISDVTREEFEHSLSQVAPGSVASIAWQTYIPKTSDYFTFRDPLAENFLPRKTEGSGTTYYKVFVPRSLFSETVLITGNHKAHNKGGSMWLPETILPFTLGHFPVRSPQQIIIKNIIATNHLNMMENRATSQGWHVYQTHDQLRSDGYRLEYEKLKQISMDYAATGTPAELEIDLNGAPIRQEIKEIRYKAQADRSVISALDVEMELLAKKILNYKQVISASKNALSGAVAKINETTDSLNLAESKAV